MLQLDDHVVVPDPDPHGSKLNCLSGSENNIGSGYKPIVKIIMYTYLELTLK